MDLSFFRGKQFHNRRLNHWNQGHIGICGNRDWRYQIRCQVVGNIDSRRAVSAADDTDSGSLTYGEQASCICQHEGNVDTELCGSTEQ